MSALLAFFYVHEKNTKKYKMKNIRGIPPFFTKKEYNVECKL